MLEFFSVQSNLHSHRVFLLASNLARCLEVDTEKCLVALLALADILDRVDVERNGKPMNRQDNRRCFPINKNLSKMEMSAFCDRVEVGH